MDAQFEELAQRLADDVERRFAKRFDESEVRLEERLATRLEERLPKRVADDVEMRLEGVIIRRLDEAETRLSEGARVYMEELKSLVKLSAEGYGATLEHIERQLTELNTKFEIKVGDHDRVLHDHASRIKALERRR